MQYLANNDEAHIFVSCLRNLCVSYDIDGCSVKRLFRIVECLHWGLNATIACKLCDLVLFLILHIHSPDMSRHLRRNNEALRIKTSLILLLGHASMESPAKVSSSNALSYDSPDLQLPQQFL